MIQVSKPAKRLKPFFWNKFSAQAASPTIWDTVSSDVSVDLADLEATFSLDNIPTSASQLSLSSPKKQDVTTLLDNTRAQNVGMYLELVVCSDVDDD